MKQFPFTKQYDTMDCGPTCLKMIAAYYGADYSLELLRENSFITREGVNMLGISNAAETIGLRTLCVKVKPEKLKKHTPFPCILYWNQNHFVVLYKAKKDRYYIADPAAGKFILKEEDFLKSWISNSNEGIALLVEPGEAFGKKNTLTEQDSKKGFGFLLGYLKQYRSYIFQLFLSMLVGTGITLLFPFLTQAVVDHGINDHNIGFVQLVLISQLILFTGGFAIEMIRSWLMLHMNSRINMAIISDFLVKLMKLPISYFDSKHIGDIKQRLGDHSRIQSFLTGSALSTAFSMVNLVVFIVIIAVYNIKILAVYLFFSILGFIWIVLFLNKRKKLDYIRFQQASDQENILYELITGMQEIKLNNCETVKRWGWERMQAKLFTLSIKGLSLAQTQRIGYFFFNQLKNILISYIAAREVINGNITMGMMISISYITGQLDGPIQLMLGFIQSAQDARISLDRLSEIHNKKNEEEAEQMKMLPSLNPDNITLPGKHNQAEGAICLQNVSFQYQGPSSPFALKDINVVIPKGKVTAIVGMSGSGKTTLMKLLLKFYTPTGGKIEIDGYNLNNISPRYWRSQCGTVMQDGYIFNDSIAKNIALNIEEVDHKQLKKAVTVANIQDFINDLPLGFHTQIGMSGIGISAGQKQRMLIARAVYKDPQFIFFDEATNALDSNNESTILDNLEKFFQGKTVIVIAHRLSTVRTADNILVMENGTVIESGNHTELLALNGKYYELVRNQLELQS